MRIHLKLSKNLKPVNFNYQPKLTGALHKWLGKNKVHEELSLYSFSMLRGAEVKENVLGFPNGAEWFISAYDNNLLKDIVLSIRKEPEVAFGMEVDEITIQETPDFSNIEFFKIAAPVFIKRKIENTTKHFLYTDKEASLYLTETMKHKMKQAGLDEDSSLQIEFSEAYSKAKSKLLDYNGIKNKASWCPIIIKAKPETKAFAWNVGVGNSTGIGFGALI